MVSKLHPDSFVFATLFFFVGFLSFAALQARAADARNVRVTVDPRVELMSIVLRLAGNPEYNEGRLPGYVQAVETHFSPFRDHEAVKIARRLWREHGVAFDAVMSFAIHLDAGINEAIPFDPRPETLDRRWTSSKARSFLAALRHFAAESEFDLFFASNQTLHLTAVSRMEELIEEHGRFGWFDQFFGARPGASFTLVIALLNGTGAYGPRIEKDGHEDIYCIFPANVADASGLPEFSGRALPFVAHEFCHSYVNPLVDRNMSKLRQAGELMFPPVASEMKRQNYNNWRTMMRESVVRACVVRYLLATQGEEAAENEIRKQVRLSFHWTSELEELLAEYEFSRDQNASFETFFATIIRFFDGYAPRFSQKMKGQAKAKRMKIAAFIGALAIMVVGVLFVFRRRIPRFLRIPSGPPNSG